MSRNLCRVDCVFCEGIVRVSERPRPIAREECGVYWEEFMGMLVAKAACVDCEASYLAWVDERGCRKPTFGHRQHAGRGASHFDLSHYHSFNDEPALEDMPKHAIEVVRQRKPWPSCYVCAKPMLHGHCFDLRCGR